MNVRFFPIELKIKKGNSFDHTAVKLLEIGAGYLLGILIKKYIPL